MRIRARASILLRRAQLILLLAALVPTILMIALGIVLLALGASSVAVVAGVLMLAFCGSAIVGYVLALIFVGRGATLARVQSDFLSSVSHELRTPLTSMRVFVETLEDGRVTDAAEQRRCLALIHRELMRLDGLVARLLELSRLQTGRQVMERKPVDVSGLLEEVVASFRAVTLGEEPNLSVEVAPDLWVRGDRAALAQVIGNLLTNAWKYAPSEGKKIALSACAAGRKHVEIAVADNGRGVPPEERERIFESFVRGRAAADGAQPGFGLGLAIVRAFVRAHRGSVRLEPNGGGGARFVVRLPRLRGEERPS